MRLTGWRFHFLCLGAVITAAALALWPGLGGPFLFDDLPSLRGLTTVHEEGSLYRVWQYVSTGASSVLGRPLALLTFAAQAGSWPAQPADFIRVNLLLHLANGALWYGVVRALQRLGAVGPNRWIAPLAAALWVLLPIHTSAVLYVVQRMAVLATSFSLLGILLYVTGREVAATRPRSGYALMSAGVLVALAFGTLSKESAAVTPLLLLLLEATALASVPRPARWRGWSAAFLVAPTLLLLGYLASRFPEFQAGYAARGFTLGERLLTECRVLFAYLASAFLPTSSARLLYDDFALSTSPLQPWTTAAAAAGWALTLALGVTQCRRWPLLSLAAGWFLAGHLLESTVIPLEIAFDHRNYLPLLGVALALAAGITAAAERAAPRARTLIAFGTGAYLVTLTGSLWLASTLWGVPLQQARQWVVRQPDSARAAYYYGRLMHGYGLEDESRRFFVLARQRWPDETAITLALVDAECSGAPPSLPPAEARRTVRAAAPANAALAANTAIQLADRAAAGHCPNHPPDELLALLDTMLANPSFAPMRAPLFQAGAFLLDGTGRKAEALDRLDRAIAIEPQVPLLQQAILWSVQLGDEPRARAYLGTLESARIAPRARLAYRREIQGMRQLVELNESLK